MSYAVIRTGGKQYRVEVGATLRVEKLEAEVASMREEMALLKAMLAERETPAADPLTQPLGANVEPAVRLRKRATKD